MRAIRALLMATALAACAAADTTFMSLGDWGCMSLNGWQAKEEAAVAATFTKFAKDLKPEFILNPGDSFYYCGVHNTTDPVWETDFEGIFTDPSTFVPWWSALGNHDYGYPGSAEAEIAYKSPNNNRWRMPDRYYYERFTVGGGAANVSLIVLDTSPCQSEYRSTDQSGWDPCGSVIPGCPGCTFHENVIAQSCTAQLTWLNGILPTVPADDWKIVMAHAPAQGIDVEDLLTPLQKAGFHLYLNGHVHLLSMYQMDGGGTYITSGAGCLVHDYFDRESGQYVEDKRTTELGYTPSSCDDPSNKWHTCTNIFTKVIPGFTTHTFNANFSELTTNLIDYQGNTIYTVVTEKAGGNSPEPQPPAPTIPPAPEEGCCFYYSESCTHGQKCCNDESYSYEKAACAGWEGKKHNCYWSWTEQKCFVS